MNNQNHSILDDDRIGRLLLKLSLPAFFGMFVTTLYSVVNTIFIGHYVGPLGIAGIAIVFPIQMLGMGLGMMAGMGGASLIARLIGANDRDSAEHALGNAMTFIIMTSITLMIVGLSNINFWLSFLGASATILPYARDYMSIILIGIVFQNVAMSLSNLTRAEGNARVSMTGMIIGAVTNIIFDAIFIVTLKMGVKGAAIGTVIAQLISVIYFMSYYFSGKSFLKIHSRNLAFDRNILKGILAIGMASFLMTMAGSIAGVLANRMLIAYGGDYAVSAYGIANRIMMFAVMPGMTIGQGVQPILGYNYGARRYDRALKAIKIAIIAATCFCSVIFVAIFFAPEIFVRIFTTDNELITLASYGAKRMFLALYLTGFCIVGSFIFQSLGKVKQTLVTAVSRSFLFVLPLLLLMPKFLQLEGVWLAFPAAEVLTFILTLTLIIPQIREFKKEDILTRGAVIEVRPN